MRLTITPRRIATPPDSTRSVIGFFFERNGDFEKCEPVYYDKSGLWRFVDDLIVGMSAGLRYWTDWPAMPSERISSES
jgi:hypothetical protein